MGNQKENTVPGHAHQEAVLSKEVQLYLVSISLFFESFKRGEISQKDMVKIEEKIMKKSGINPLSIYRINDLIVTPTRANIVVREKEVISNEINKVRKIARTSDS